MFCQQEKNNLFFTIKIVGLVLKSKTETANEVEINMRRNYVRRELNGI